MTSLYKAYFLIALFAVSAVTLSACSLDEPGHMNTSRVQVEEKKFIEEMPVAEVDPSYVASLGKYYGRYGDGEIALTVTYDSASRSNTAMKASNEASRILSLFRKNGMHHVKANIFPVKDQGSESTAIVSFVSYTAHAPKDCTVMSGYENKDISVEEDYKLGCTIETAFAKQISRPKDLKGQGVEDATSDGRRASNIIELHRIGTPNEPLGGESASGGE